MRTYLPLTGHSLPLKRQNQAFFDHYQPNLIHIIGVFSTGAIGALAPTTLRKRLIASAILHLPFQYLLFIYSYFLLERRHYDLLKIQ